MQPLISRILVPVDFSTCARAAVNYAAVLGERFEASLDVLHVWEPPYYRSAAAEPLAMFARTEAGREMEEVLSGLEERGIAQAHGRLEFGNPVDAILEAALAGGYDLIVMGTHGRSGLSLVLRGSVAESIVRRAPCPVLTIHEAGRQAKPAEMGPPDSHKPSSVDVRVGD